MAEKQPKSSMQDLIDSLSPIERKIIPFLNEKIGKIIQKSQLDETSVLRALRFLENKGLVKIDSREKKIIELGTNGIYYKKHHLPERKLLMLLENSNYISIDEARKLSKLSENEFKVSLGVLKSKALISLANRRISLKATKEELTRKSLEEQLLDMLPIEEEKLSEEHKLAFFNLRKRKEIVEIKRKAVFSFQLTELCRELAGQEIRSDLIEEVNSDIIKNWDRSKKFRKYNITLPVPRVYGGKRHFVNQAIEYGKRIWTDLGFREMTGPLVDSSFWVFDSLFTPQDHPAREMQDTFFIREMQAKLPDKKLVESVKQAHESGVAGSKGWQYSWKSDIARKVVLRTHTTSLSARYLASLKPSDLPKKFFSIGKVFRNETIDWKHGFEFYQTDCIVVDEKANFRHLLGYLREFYKKMGYKKIKFVPSFFAYTEPSVEVQYWHSERKEWIELGGAGIFRPEVTAALFGKPIPVLAWGQGFDRIIMEYYNVQDLRELYTNDTGKLRKKEFWVK